VISGILIAERVGHVQNGTHGLAMLLQGALAKLLLFNRLDTQIQRKLVAEMFERNVNAGEILIKEGDTGLAATELYVVKSGKFEVRWI
jgi:CRP-like cAMP-binding protein